MQLINVTLELFHAITKVRNEIQFDLKVLKKY